MPNIAQVFKSEIARLAKRETRSTIDALKKQSAHYRTEIAALKRRLDAVEKQGRKAARSLRVPLVDPSEAPTKLFRPAGLASQRAKLGLSAREAGLLLGVSGLTVYKWEKGSSRPRAKQMQAIAATYRKLGKREAVAQLEDLG